uniref:FP protein C-terminal domain-containing protein n=1 Tax=Cacopsylla melanoneura TaxID=428564 RepID=A0A8D9B526_9HEMI
MFKCSTCHDDIPTDSEYAVCSECTQGYHLDGGCSVARTTWKGYGSAKRDMWKCRECKGTKKGNDNDNDNDSEPTDQNAGNLSEKPATEQGMQKLFEKFSQEIQKQMLEFEKSIQHNSNVMDSVLSSFDELKRNMTNVQAKQVKLEKENEDMKRTIRDLSCKLMENEQKTYDRCLEVNGIPETITDPKKIVTVLCKKAEVQVPSENSFTVERSRMGPQNKPKSITIKFESKIARDAIFKGCKAKKPQVSDFTGNERDKLAVFVNEQMSPTNKKLFYQANQIRKEKNFAYLWFADNKILLKKTQESRAVRIYDIQDVNK